MKRAEYHVHTSASYDSRATPDAVIDRALHAGIDVLCVTDHDTLDGAVAVHARAPASLEVIVGCELTADDGSHVIALGIDHLVAERRLPHLLDAVRAEGGVVILPHLYRRGSGIFRPELRRTDAFVREVLARADAVESFNARDRWEQNARSRLLAERHGLPTVAGSDAHAADEVGRVFVEYPGASFVHGASPRRIFHPPQAPGREGALRRRALEAWHLVRPHLPPPVRAAYRAARSLLRPDRPRLAAGEPVLQQDLPGLEGRRRENG